MVLSTYVEKKTKALISFAVTAKLNCVFVFAYAKCLFSHNATQNFVKMNSPPLSFVPRHFSDHIP